MAAPHVLSAIDEAKRAMRVERMAARSGLDPRAAGEAVTGLVLRDCPPPPDAVVSGFWPLDNEIDIRPLLLALHACGHPIVLPVTPKRGLPLSFRLWRPGDTMVAERFGTMRPIGEERSPTFLLVPLLAFDRRGGRLGYGAGYYDRTLSLLSPRFALGCAFAAQEVPKVPMGPNDVRLDAVATKRELIHCPSR
jgi:5-formyltetrahydrofolate cyclo-ligase